MALNPHESYFVYYNRYDLQAVLSGDGRWKLVFPHQFRTLVGRPGGFDGKPSKYYTAETLQALYDLRSDIGETTDLSMSRPDIMLQLEVAAARIRFELGDELTGVEGKKRRPPGRVD
jgi:hypothetical protein